MAPLIVQLVAWAGFWLAGVTGLLGAAATPVGALRFALAAMFVFTAVSHFLPRTRADLIRLVPSSLPAPAFLVSLTGVLEFVGAIGLAVAPLAWLPPDWQYCWSRSCRRTFTPLAPGWKSPAGVPCRSAFACHSSCSGSRACSG